MRRILLLITDLEIGGTPTVVRELALRLNTAGGCVVEVACIKRPGPVAGQLKRAGVTVKAFSADSAIDLPAVVSELRAFIAEQQYDTVFSFLIHANLIAALACRKLSAVRLLQSVQTCQPSPRWHWWLQWIVQHAADRVVVPSPSAAAAASGWADVPADKITIIANAIDMPPTPIAMDKLLHNPPIIGFVGRLDPIKHVPDLVAAVARIKNVRLAIWGEGPHHPAIEQAIAAHRLNDRVTLHGVAASADEALAAMDCLVLPSAAEGFGLVLIEAMAAGVAVVGTNVAGIRDVIHDEQTALLAPVNNPAALAETIERMLDDEPLRRRCIEQARREVAERFTWQTVLPQYQGLLGITPDQSPSD